MLCNCVTLYCTIVKLDATYCCNIIRLQGLSRPEHMAQALARAGTQGVEFEELLRFAHAIAGDDGLISIHDMCGACAICFSVVLRHSLQARSDSNRYGVCWR